MQKFRRLYFYMKLLILLNLANRTKFEVMNTKFEMMDKKFEIMDTRIRMLDTNFQEFSNIDSRFEIFYLKRKT